MGGPLYLAGICIVNNEKESPGEENVVYVNR